MNDVKVGDAVVEKFAYRMRCAVNTSDLCMGKTCMAWRTITAAPMFGYCGRAYHAPQYDYKEVVKINRENEPKP